MLPPGLIRLIDLFGLMFLQPPRAMAMMTAMRLSQIQQEALRRPILRAPASFCQGPSGEHDINHAVCTMLMRQRNSWGQIYTTYRTFAVLEEF
jgi:hypothetical protein